MYTWWEVWFVVGVAAVVPSTWLAIGLMLQIPNDIMRTVSIWSFVITLVVGSALVDALRKQDTHARG